MTENDLQNIKGALDNANTAIDTKLNTIIDNNAKINDILSNYNLGNVGNLQINAQTKQENISNQNNRKQTNKNQKNQDNPKNKIQFWTSTKKKIALKKQQNKKQNCKAQTKMCKQKNSPCNKMTFCNHKIQQQTKTQKTKLKSRFWVA